jgi:hypothetical protein
MIFCAFLALSSVLFVLGEDAYPANKKYCAHIASGVAAGAQGFFAMEIDSSTGTATYKFEVDTRAFTSPTSCDFAQGLDWHLHSKWDLDDDSSTDCGNAGTGPQNHYDPNFACGPASQSAGAMCDSMGLISSDGYEYACTQASYQGGNFGMCEVGDLSGKFGDIKPNGDGIMSSGFLHDPLPPYIVDYAAPNDASHHWESVVFHCKSASGARILCAKFLEDTGTDSECTYSVILLFFLLFLFVMVSMSLLSIYYCLSAFSDTT